MKSRVILVGNIFKVLKPTYSNYAGVASTFSDRFIIPLNSHSIVEFLDLIGDELTENGFEPVYIPENKYINKTAERVITDGDLRQEYINHEAKSSFPELCRKYGIDSFRSLVFSQMVYERSYDSPSQRSYWFSGTSSLDYEKYRDLTHRTLDYLDQMYERGNGGIPLQYQGGEVIRRVLQRVADYHGYTSVRTSFSPIPNQLLFRPTERMCFPILKTANYEEMTSDQRKKARGFRRRITENQQQVMGSNGQSDTLYENLRRKVRRIQEHQDDPIPIISNWLRLRVAKPILGAATKCLYLDEEQSQEFINSNKYIFYPLQYSRESRVTMRAPTFYNQLWIIEYLSRSLPPEYELVVKDHPQQLGTLPITQVHKLRRYATAVEPTMSARKILTEADAVVTLNNTVGFEAVMYGKPVITLGDAFYSGAGYTRDVANLDSLPAELNEALDCTGLREERILEFAHGLLESSYEGKWGDTDTGNIKAFVASIIEFLDEKNINHP